MIITIAHIWCAIVVLMCGISDAYKHAVLLDGTIKQKKSKKLLDKKTAFKILSYSVKICKLGGCYE